MRLTPASMHTLESWTVWADVDLDSLLSKLALVPVMCSHVNCKHRQLVQLAQPGRVYLLLSCCQYRYWVSADNM